MNFYKLKDKKIFSKESYNLQKINQKELIESEDSVYFLYEMNSKSSKESFLINDLEDIFKNTESINDIRKKSNNNYKPMKWLEDKIMEKKVIGINTSHNDWKDEIFKTKKNKFDVNILGLGDVGSTLLIGLRLLGKDVINEIGIYDLNDNKIKRWEKEINQICLPEDFNLPRVKIINKDQLFDTDMFIFTASKYVPKVGSEISDVRMAQYEANAEIIKEYSKMASDNNFKGIFSVVSDPVDLLCNEVLYNSNLKPNQIRGYGLGVMNGRAHYYSEQFGYNYSEEGRVFGPHGKGLIVADSINNYDHKKSNKLTKAVTTANLDIRDLGFKPYVAPALSSGAISIVETLKGNWNYSTVFINGIYWGVKNRLINNTVEYERLNLSDELMSRIFNSYKELKDSYERF